MLALVTEPGWITLALVAVYAVLVTVGLVRARRAEHEAYDVAAALLDELRGQEWERLLLRSAVFVAGPGTEEDEGGELDVRA